MIALAPTSPAGVDASALDIDRSPTDSRMLAPLVPYSTLDVAGSSVFHVIVAELAVTLVDLTLLIRGGRVSRVMELE
jgi:hypothetical protein